MKEEKQSFIFFYPKSSLLQGKRGDAKTFSPDASKPRMQRTQKTLYFKCVINFQSIHASGH